jgi:alcohol dehydrogenase YqhD (iron-dependent ADH family)
MPKEAHMNEAREAAERLVKYFENLGTDAEVEDYDPAEDARKVREALEA